jgi:hypothetical protein
MSNGYTKKGGRSKRKNKTRKGGMRKKDISISDINAVLKMINCPGATLEVISIDSLYGFVFLLTIPQRAEEDCIQFIGLDGNPIYQIILKVALCYYGEKPNHTSYTGVIDDTEYKKSAMNWYVFLSEAEKQRQIFRLFPLNPVTFGVGCCHMYYREQPFNPRTIITNNEDITEIKYTETYAKKNETILDIFTTENTLDIFTTENTLENSKKRKMTEIISKERKMTEKERETRETIRYIKHILTTNIDYNFAFIAMDAAMNYIDRNKYDILTLRDVRLHESLHYPRCMEYANAIIILLFKEKKWINIDAHSGNFLSNVNHTASLDDNVKSWMIDMGRIVEVTSDIWKEKYLNKYIKTSDSRILDPYYNRSLRDIYYFFHKRDCKTDIDFILYITYKWNKLVKDHVINSENILQILHVINTFIVMMDYCINFMKYNHNKKKPPQCIRFSEYIINNDISSYINDDISSDTKVKKTMIKKNNDKKKLGYMSEMVELLNIYLPPPPPPENIVSVVKKNILSVFNKEFRSPPPPTNDKILKNMETTSIPDHIKPKYVNIYECMKKIDKEMPVVEIPVVEIPVVEIPVVNKAEYDSVVDMEVDDDTTNGDTQDTSLARIIKLKKTNENRSYTQFSNDFLGKDNNNQFFSSQKKGDKTREKMTKKT